MNAPKRIRPRIAWARHAVQLGAVALFAFPFVACGWRLFGPGDLGPDRAAAPGDLPFFGTLTSSTVFGAHLIDPLSAAQLIVSAKGFALEWLIAVLPVLAVYGVVRGRAFCGWVCPVGIVVEAAGWMRARFGLRPRAAVLPRRAKVAAALVVVALSGAVGVPVFRLFSPIGVLGGALAAGSAVGAALLAAIVACELVLGNRLWCRCLCPLGGVYEALGRAGQVNVWIDHARCIGCDACRTACLAHPSVLDGVLAGTEPFVRAGDCMACGACVDACPSRALRFRAGRLQRVRAEQVVAQGEVDEVGAR